MFTIVSSERKCWKIEQQLKVEIEDSLVQLSQAWGIKIYRHIYIWTTR